MSAIGNTSLTQVQVMNEINTSVMRKAFDTMEQQGQAAISLLQEAAALQDKALASSDGKGQLIDYHA
jgi:hypothetical protein